jgi:hypothetical protein
MRVENIALTASGGVAELSGEIDGFRLWHQFPSEFEPLVPGNVFLCACLLVAMRAGEPLEIPEPCSARLLDNVRGPIQDIFTAWFPELRRIEVHAATANANHPRGGRIVFLRRR